MPAPRIASPTAEQLAGRVADLVGATVPDDRAAAGRASGAMGPLRPTADPFDIGDARCGGLHNPAASRAAEAIAVTMGDHHPEIDRYIGVLGYAPIAHIDVLRRRGAQIAFAPTVAHYLLSADAAQRRAGRGYAALTTAERDDIAKQYGPQSPVVAAYDQQSDALVLPYSRSGPDKLRSALHELGHAMTWEPLAGREAEFADVLRHLPEWIQKHLRCGYAADLATRVHESFAEAYAMLVCERVDELGMIASELVGILNSVQEPGKPPPSPLWRLDLSGGTSASLGSPNAVQTVGPVPSLDEQLPIRPTTEAREPAEDRAA
jgi:hypothetical protein